MINNSALHPKSDGTVFADELTDTITEPESGATYKLKYTVSGDEVTITGYESVGATNNSPVNLVIPEKIDNKNVVAIGSRAFRNCASLKTVIVSNSVGLGVSVFQSCTGLQYVEIRIKYSSADGAGFFSACSSLEYARVNFENESRMFCTWMFAFEVTTSTLKTIFMEGGSGSVIGLGMNFFGCTALKSITIPACYFDGGETYESEGFDFVPPELMEGRYPTDLKEIYMASSTALSGLQDNWKAYTVSNSGVMSSGSAVGAENVLGNNGATVHYVRSDISASDIFVLEMRSDKVLDESEFYTLSADKKTAYKVCVKGSVFGELPTYNNGTALNWQYGENDVVWHSDVANNISANDNGSYVLTLKAEPSPEPSTGVVIDVLIPVVAVSVVAVMVALVIIDSKRNGKFKKNA